MKTIKFKDFVALQRGFDLPKAKRVKGNVPLVASSKIDGSHNTFKVKAPGVVTGRSGSLGRVQYISKAFWPLNTTLWVKDFKGNNEKYIYYFLQTLDLAQYNSGAGVPTLNRNHLDELLINVHEYCEQTKIEKLLSNYDHLIENNNRRIAILEDMAQSLYREWFVNFRYPGHANDVDKDGNQKLIDSPLGQIPEGWVVKPLMELVNFKRNTIKKGNVSERTPYMGLEHFPRKSIALSEWEEVSEIGSNKLGFNLGDILFGKIRPNFHKVGVAQVDGVCSSDTFVFSPKNAKHHALISMVTFSNEFVAQAVQTSQGSKMPRASWDVLKEFPVPVPAQYIMEKFSSVVDPAIKQIRVLSLKNRNLKKQRDMLLPKLISGQIELKD
jgi:type I restriction enzyme S subunit